MKTNFLAICSVLIIFLFSSFTPKHNFGVKACTNYLQIVNDNAADNITTESVVGQTLETPPKSISVVDPGPVAVGETKLFSMGTQTGSKLSQITLVTASSNTGIITVYSFDQSKTIIRINETSRRTNHIINLSPALQFCGGVKVTFRTLE